MPKAIVLGTAQDGGFPHAGCRCAPCEGARTDTVRARRIACLGLVDGLAGFLVDATPDLPRQVTGLPGLSGLLLTHAHMGHVGGLLWLGTEAMAVTKLPVWLGPRLFDHLSGNEPWATLVRDRRLAPRVVGPDEEFAPTANLTVRAIPVPHRGEWSETYAYRIAGPAKSLLWLPDIDRFEEGALERLLDGVDVAFLDGTFWSDDELPDRDMTKIPHPRIRDTAHRLAKLRPTARIAFVHLNHSNPCLDPASPESAELAAIFRDAGLRTAGDSPVAAEDTEIEL